MWVRVGTGRIRIVIGYLGKVAGIKKSNRNPAIMNNICQVSSFAGARRVMLVWASLHHPKRGTNELMREREAQMREREREREGGADKR